MSTTWHNFRESPDGDDECAGCGTAVAPAAHLTFTLSCPVPPCPAPTNPDHGCCFAVGRGGLAACVYCTRPGSRAGEIPPPSALEESFAADLA